MNALTREILALGFVPGLTTGNLARLLNELNNPMKVAHLPPHRLARFGLKGKAITALRSMEPYRQEADRQIALAQEHGARIITRADPSYPVGLREIWSPPAALYVLGELLPEDQNGVAVVGTRNPTTYGRIAAERYGATIAAAGITVVSGLARGIDTWAHREAMRSGGRTIAVVASGLDKIQPQNANALAREIARSGAVVTEYRFGTRALRPYFPQRNRIISGMTVGTLLVESDLKGGGMITARYAFDQDREVFALPGPVTSPKSAGPNRLIRIDRARLTSDPEDLLESLGFRLPVSEEGSEKRTLDLSLFEQKVYDHLGSEPIHVDTLSNDAGMSPHELLVTLLSLEFKGLARQMAGKRFLRSR